MKRCAKFMAIGTALISQSVMAAPPTIAACINDTRVSPAYFASTSIRRQLVGAETRDHSLMCYWSESDPFTSGAAPAWTACMADNNVGCAIVAIGQKVYVAGAGSGVPPVKPRWTLIGDFAKSFSTGLGAGNCVVASPPPEFGPLPVYICY